VPRYLLEGYVGDTASARSEVVERASAVSSLGADIRHIRTTFVPDDQVVLHVFEAPSAGALRRAGRRAGLRYERLVEAFEAGTGGAAPNNKGGVT
jgi:hypothetical protein